MSINSSYKDYSIIFDSTEHTSFFDYKKNSINYVAENASPINNLFAIPKKVSVAYWQILFLLLSIFLIGLVKAFSKNRFKQGIKALFKFAVAQEIIREEKVFFHRSNLLFTLIHLVLTALFVFELQSFFQFEKSGIYLFVSILSFLIGVYFVKYLAFKILAFIFNSNGLSSDYIFSVSLYNSLQATFFVPILFLIYFSEIPFHYIFFYISIPILFFVFSMRLIRLFKIGKQKGVLYVYIFVYICTLEILPLVVLLKIFILS